MHTIWLDLETTGLDTRKDKIRLIQSMEEDGTISIFDVWKEPKRIEQLIAICENPEIKKVWMNGAFDMGFIRVAAGRRVRFVNHVDIMLTEQVLLAGWSTPYLDKKTNEQKKRMPGFSLKDMVWRHLGITLDKTQQKSDWSAPTLSEAQLQYAGEDVHVMQEIYNIQYKLLKLNGLEKVAQLEYETLAPIVEMQVSGMPFDAAAAEEAVILKTKERDEKLRALDQMVLARQSSRQMTLFGEVSTKSDMNMNSPTQIVKELKKLGYDVSSSDVETLKEIDHPWAQGLLGYRHTEKQVMFLTQWLYKFNGKSGRLYPHYNQNRAATGRMSSSNYNAQQVPKRGDGAAFRKLFKTHPGFKMVKVDYSAIEMRMVAAVSKDQVMIDAVKNGVDLHKLTASTVTGVPIEEVTKVQRQQAKAVNFGMCYSMGAKTFQKYARLNYGVNMTESEAQDAHKAYHKLYSGVDAWQQDTSRKVKKEVNEYWMHTHDKGFYVQKVFNTETIFGRKRFYPDWGGESTAKLTDACNSPIQGSSADLTKLALVALYKALPPEAHLVTCVHDEIVCECPESMAEEIQALMIKLMCDEGNKLCKVIPIEAEGGADDGRVLRDLRGEDVESVQNGLQLGGYELKIRGVRVGVAAEEKGAAHQRAAEDALPLAGGPRISSMARMASTCRARSTFKPERMSACLRLDSSS